MSQMELGDPVFDAWQQGIAATWLFGESVRLTALCSAAAWATNRFGMALTI